MLADVVRPSGLAIPHLLHGCRETRDDVVQIFAFRAGRKCQRHAVLQDRLGKRDDVVDGWRKRVPQLNARLVPGVDHAGSAMSAAGAKEIAIELERMVG